MNHEFDSAELHRLFSELRDHTITPEDHERLELLLRRHPHARQQWFLFSDVETGLKDWAVTEDQKRVDVLPFDKKGLPSHSFFPIGVTSWFAVLLITVTMAIWFARTAVVPVSVDGMEVETLVSDVAVLTHRVNAQWRDGLDLAVGTTLAPSVIRLQSGALMIEFFSGAKVILEGPAEFELLSASKGRLLSGKLNAHVPPQARGFTVTTSVGDVVDHGTDFGLNVTDQDPCELHVFSGRVELRSEIGSLDVETGEAVRFREGATEAFDADESAFLVERELVRQSRKAAERRFAEWRDASRALSNDSANLYHLRFDHPIDAPAESRGVLVNSAMDAELVSGGHVVSSKWVSGRWEEKSGILFGGPGDRIRLEVSEPMKSVTLLAWVNVLSLPRWQNSLLSADSKIPGSIHWQLTKRGQLRLAIARDLGLAQPDWEAVESEPFLAEDQQRQWILLATTFDGSTIRHYADGRLVGRGASFTPRSLHIGTAEIGNWLGETRRELHAILDEFVVLNRVLGVEEIAEIYRVGKP